MPPQKNTVNNKCFVDKPENTCSPSVVSLLFYINARINVSFKESRLQTSYMCETSFTYDFVRSLLLRTIKKSGSE